MYKPVILIWVKPTIGMWHSSNYETTPVVISSCLWMGYLKSNWKDIISACRECMSVPTLKYILCVQTSANSKCQILETIREFLSRNNFWCVQLSKNILLNTILIQFLKKNHLSKPYRNQMFWLCHYYYAYDKSSKLTMSIC